MSKPFFNAPENYKFFPKLKTLPNIPVPCCFLCFICRFGPIVRNLFIVTFEGRFFLLTLSYHAKKDRPSGNVTRYGLTFHLNNVLFLYISPLSAFPTIK